MTPARKQRLLLVGLMVVGVSTGVGFALQALNQNIMFFYTPSEVAEGAAPQAKLFRVGGMVVDKSVRRPDDGVTVKFDLTDNSQSITISYVGILPDLFREGQGIIANGSLNAEGEFIAEEVLAKHDENYMPPELADMHTPSETIQP